MSERYTRVFSQQGQFYCSGSPVVIRAGALLKDNQTGKIIAQVKFKNISTKAIRALTVRIRAKDVSGVDVEGVDKFQYLDLDIRRDGEFGAKTPVVMPNNTTRSFICECVSAVFHDGTTWMCEEDASWDVLPTPALLMKELGAELADQYKRDTNTKSAYKVTEYEDLWHCGCGAINHDGEDICHTCRVKKATLLSALNIDLLKENKKEYDKVIAEQRAADEEAERKATKVVIIGIVAVVVLLVSLLVIGEVIAPAVQYNQALALVDKGNIIEAYDALIALDGYKDSAEKANAIFDKYKTEKIKQATVGDIVYFGNYEQDNDLTNGKETIEWLVLDVQDNQALVISKFALDNKVYHNIITGKNTTWYCELRKWLNSEFVDTAFSTDEQMVIPTVTVSTDNNITQDKVFLLSVEEVKRYFKDDSEMQCKSTDYAIANGAYVAQPDNPVTTWWLRSSSSTEHHAAIVSAFGGVIETGASVATDNAVRPAMWIDLSKIA